MTKSQKTKTTNRKFYNKWLYKITLRVPGTGVFRVHSLESIIDFCSSSSNPDDRPYSLFGKAWNNRESILELAELLVSYDPSIWAKRIEQDFIDFYTNDKGFYETLSDKFEESITHRFEPDTVSLDLLDQSQAIVCSKLPHNKYNYRVYLLPHKMNGDKEAKKKYVEWLKVQSPKITCTPAVEKWFIKTDWNWDRRYVLVEDDHTLLMLKLRNSEVVGRVYNYVLTDK